MACWLVTLCQSLIRLDLKDQENAISPVNQLSFYPGFLYLWHVSEISDVHTYVGFEFCFFPSPITYWIEIEVLQESWLVCFFLGRRGRELIARQSWYPYLILGKSNGKKWACIQVFWHSNLAVREGPPHTEYFPSSVEAHSKK